MRMFPSTTAYETFSPMLHQNHNRFAKPKVARSDSAISHYAGHVSYCLPSLLDCALPVACWLMH